MIEKIGMNGIVKDTTRDYLNNFPLYNYVSSLGSFGKVVFRVSQDNILTPTQVGKLYQLDIKNTVGLEQWT